MKPYQTIHVWGKGMEEYLGNIMLARPRNTKMFSDELEELVESWGDKRKVRYVTFE